jgi:nitroreductase
MKTEDFSPVRKDFALTSAQAEHFLRTRRSIRSYQDKAVEHEKIAGMVDIARYAPTGTNSQQVGWIAVNSRAEGKKMAGMVIDMVRNLISAKNPITEKYRLANAVTALESGSDTISRGAPALVFVHAPNGCRRETKRVSPGSSNPEITLHPHQPDTPQDRHPLEASAPLRINRSSAVAGTVSSGWPGQKKHKRGWPVFPAGPLP